MASARRQITPPLHGRRHPMEIASISDPLRRSRRTTQAPLPEDYALTSDSQWLVISFDDAGATYYPAARNAACSKLDYMLAPVDFAQEAFSGSRVLH